MNTPKTAMGELIEKLNNTGDDTVFCIWFEANKERLLEKEKQQIIEAYVDGDWNGTENHPYMLAEDYYNQTFNQ